MELTEKSKNSGAVMTNLKRATISEKHTKQIHAAVHCLVEDHYVDFDGAERAYQNICSFVSNKDHSASTGRTFTSRLNWLVEQMHSGRILMSRNDIHIVGCVL